MGVPGIPDCNGDVHAAREGRKSFPSGHSSMAFAGMFYLSLYLAARLQPWAEPSSAPWRMLAAGAPSAAAAWVGLTRIRDYYHHWSDVFAGTLLGCAVAYASFAQHRGTLSGGGGGRPYRALGGAADDSVLLRGAAAVDMTGSGDRELDC